MTWGGYGALQGGLQGVLPRGRAITQVDLKIGDLCLGLTFADPRPISPLWLRNKLVISSIAAV